MARLSKKERRRNAALSARETMLREPRDPSVVGQTEIEKVVINRAYARMSYARRNGIPYDRDLPAKILADCREQEERCALSGIAFSMDAHGLGAAPRPFSPSIDRIDPDAGYVSTNCRIVCWAVNIFCGVWGSDIALRLARGMVLVEAKSAA